MPPIKDDKTLLIRCICHYHILEVTYDNYDADSPTVFNISIWNQSPVPINFWDRLKMIWRLIRFKNLEGGDVIIENSDAKTLINFLNKHLGEKKHGKQKSNKTDTTRRSS
jgi:hypothetical protein